MKNYFRISEYLITDEVTPRVADMILLHHILPMNPIREELEEPIIVSKNSGYRPKIYEISKGRSGNSQHTFREDLKHGNGKGAADYTADNLNALHELILNHSPYKRVCIYPKSKFIHCDYGYDGEGMLTFEDNGNGWERKEF